MSERITDDEFITLLKARLAMPLQKDPEQVMQRKEIESLIAAYKKGTCEFSKGVVAALKKVIYRSDRI